MSGFGFPFSSMFTIVFVLVIGTFIFAIIRNVSQWSSNNSKPIGTKSVQVVAKRTHTWGGGGGVNHSSHARTSYYVTFEFEDGERLELHVGSRHYGQIAEGDVGMLKYQGTRFHEFERSRW